MPAQGSLIAIGCGDFGGAVIDALALRGAAAVEGVRLLRAPGVRVATRRESAERFAAEQLPNWPELGQAVQQLPGALIGLVAAAGEVAGSAALIETVVAIARQYRNTPWAVWLALPAGGADRPARARAYAALLELEQLRKLVDARCFVAECEPGAGHQRTASRFADAVLAHACSSQSAGGYYGFGVGVLPNPEHDLFTRLRPRIAAVAAASMQLGEPAALPDLEREFEQLAEPFFVDIRETPLVQKRFTADGNPISRPNRVNQHWLDDLRQDQRNHYDYRISLPYRNARDTLTRQRTTVERRLTEIIRQAGSHGALADVTRLAAGLAQIRAAVAARLETLAAEGKRYTDQTVAERDQLRQAVMGANPDFQQLVTRFHRMDEYLACFYSQGLVGVELERLERCIAEQLIPLLQDVDKRAEFRGQLLAALTQGRAREQPPSPHILPPPIAAEQEQAWLDRLVPAHTQNRLKTVLQQTPPIRQAAEQVADGIQQDVNGMIDAGVPLYRSAGDPQFRVWLEQIRPALALRAGTQPGAAGPPVAYWQAGSLPPDYSQALVQQGIRPGATLRWPFPETVIYGVLGPIEPQWLAALPELYEAYLDSQPGVSGLHTVEPPPAGWPDLMPREYISPRRLQELAQVVVQCSVLGLLTPTGAANAVVARYLTDAGEAVATRELGTLPQAVQALARDEELRRSLTHLAASWVADLPPERLAGYCALVRWFAEQVDGAGNEPVLEALRSACRQEQARLGAGAGSTPPPGSPDDTYSLAVGPWRYLQW